jgi:hypothetical protein
MKITLIHGSYTTTSRKRYLQIVEAVAKRGWEIVPVSRDQNLENSLRGQSLFGNETLYYIDGHFTKLDPKDLTWLKTKSPKLDANLLIYQDGEISQKYIKALGSNAKIEKFDLPKHIFVFLDSLYPGNSKQCVVLLHQVLENEPIEFVFALMAGLFRDLYWIKVAPQTISLPPWRAGKLKKQASFYSSEKIISMIAYFAELDLKVKLSRANLVQSLDLFLIRDLK